MPTPWAQGVAVQFRARPVTNPASGKSLPGVVVPKSLVDLMLGGGIMPLLESEGFIAPRTAAEESQQSAS